MGNAREVSPGISNKESNTGVIFIQLKNKRQDSAIAGSCYQPLGWSGKQEGVLPELGAGAASPQDLGPGKEELPSRAGATETPQLLHMPTKYCGNSLSQPLSHLPPPLPTAKPGQKPFSGTWESWFPKHRETTMAGETA